MRRALLGLLLPVLACKGSSSSSSSEGESARAQPASAAPKRAPDRELGAAVPPAPSPAPPSPSPSEPSLVSFGAGALVVGDAPESEPSWSAFWMIDERADTGWAPPSGRTGPESVTLALPERTQLREVEFDTARADGEGRAARDVVVEMSDVGEKTGFTPIATVVLEEHKDRQRFKVQADKPGRWVRVVAKNNHGDASWLEIMDFRAYGAQLTRTPQPELGGTFVTNYNDFHLRMQGTSISGCYDYKGGVLEGGADGNVLKFTWREKDKSPGQEEGPAVIVVSRDGNQLHGLWWYKGDADGRGEVWHGKRSSKTVGTCSHWAGSFEGQLARDLDERGRARVYGINFDSASAKLRDESKTTLDGIMKTLKAKPALRLTVEGHTDATADATTNRRLSEDRAAAVKTHLVAAGVDAARLETQGFGAARPVATNDTALGRARNRRVELVKR